jgi:hypothetical protein
MEHDSNPFHVALANFFVASVIFIYGKISRAFLIIKRIFLSSPTHSPQVVGPNEALHNQITTVVTPTREFSPWKFVFQSPTHASMFVLLAMLMGRVTAHVDETGEADLHNGDALADLSVVRNWTLICEHLCR